MHFFRGDMNGICGIGDSVETWFPKEEKDKDRCLNLHHVAIEVFQNMRHHASKPLDPGITIEIDPHFPEPQQPDPNDPDNWV